MLEKIKSGNDRTFCLAHPVVHKSEAKFLLQYQDHIYKKKNYLTQAMICSFYKKEMNG